VQKIAYNGGGTTTWSPLPASSWAYSAQAGYPYDLAKAKALVAASGTSGMPVQVWASNTDPQPKAAEYMASVLSSLGYKATVKTLDEGVYYDTVATQKGDPQVSYNDWNQDFPEAQDFIDVLFNGEKITNIGNNNGSNVNVPAVNKAIDATRALPLGDARNAAWAKLDATLMQNYAPWVPFLNRQFPKFSSPKLHGLVFNGTYFELFPAMWLAK
jgi:ABC-type oligopeptide transport system substrate-binding subunit